MIVGHLICLVGGPFVLQVKAGRNSGTGRVFETVLKLFVRLVYRFKSVLTFFSASQSLILWFKHAGETTPVLFLYRRTSRILSSAQC